MIPVVALRPEASPGRFEVWDIRGAPGRRPQLEIVVRTFDDAKRAADGLLSEWGGRWVIIDTWQLDTEAQHVCSLVAP